jgi:hypothetical protein
MTSAHCVRLLGQTDQGGMPDAVKVMVANGLAYVGHTFSDSERGGSFATEETSSGCIICMRTGWGLFRERRLSWRRITTRACGCSI